MSPANLEPNWSDADGFYEALSNAHQGLTREQSEALNARLVLVLANQIGQLDVLTACIKAAQD